MKVTALILASSLLAVSAHAAISFDEKQNRAIRFFSAGEMVQASLCLNVSEAELQSPTPALDRKCTSLLGRGIGLQQIERNLNELKRERLKQVDKMINGYDITLQTQAVDTVGKTQLEDMVTDLNKNYRPHIQNLTANDVFIRIRTEALDPSIKRMQDSDDLDDLIKLVKILAQP